MPGRKYSFGTGYRYGFNGKENDNEVKGEGGEQDYGMRIYNPRIGKFLSVDPLTGSYPWYTPYQFAGNKPIAFIDLDGGEEKPTTPAPAGTPNGAPTTTSKTIYPPSDAANFDEPVTYTKTWYWYSGNLNRPAKADYYSKEEYDYITQDWEHGQVLPKHEGYSWLDWSNVERSEAMKTSSGYVIRNWYGYAVGESGYLLTSLDKDGKTEAVRYPAMMEIGAADKLLKGLGTLAKLREIAPSLFKEGSYTVYNGFKNGVLYIGKTGYTIATRYAGKIAPEGVKALEGLGGTIPNNGIAKGIEQLVMNLNGWKGAAENAAAPVLSNKNAATINEIYIEVAKRWLNQNVKDWETKFKFK